MAKKNSTVEMQELPGEVRRFDAKRDLKEGKTFVLDEGSITIKAGRTSTFDMEGHAIMNNNQVSISTGDIVTIDIDPSYMSYTILLEKSNREKQRYLLLDNDIFENQNIRIIKSRKAPKVDDQVLEGKKIVSSIVKSLNPGFSFKAKADIPEQLPTSLHAIKKGAEILIDSLEGNEIGLKVFHKGLNISKKGKLKSEWEDLLIDVEQFLRLFSDKILTNLVKKLTIGVVIASPEESKAAIGEVIKQHYSGNDEGVIDEA